MLEIKNLCFKEVLKDINLVFHEGEVTVISGPNGSGKTVLFKNILGLLCKTSGKINYCDTDGSVLDISKNVGALIEDPEFNSWISGMDNLKYLASINGHLDKEYADSLLKRFDLYKDKDKIVRKYSLGMKKKLGIIQAVMENQKLIILDEPTSSLDKESIKEFYKLIKELKMDNKIIIMASHIDEDISFVADRVIKIDAGKIINEEVVSHVKE